MEAQWLGEELLQGIKATKGPTPCPRPLQLSFTSRTSLKAFPTSSSSTPAGMTRADVHVLPFPERTQRLVKSLFLVLQRKESWLEEANQTHHFFISHKDKIPFT